MKKRNKRLNKILDKLEKLFKSHTSLETPKTNTNNSDFSVKVIIMREENIPTVGIYNY